MKRALNWLLVFVLLTPMVVSPQIAIAAGDPPPDLFKSLFLPLILGGSSTYTVSGIVEDDLGTPISDVTILDVKGNTTSTDDAGNYSLALPPGDNTLFALKAGYTFAPEELPVSVDQNLSAQNFTATLGCGDIMVNGTLDYDMGGWDFPVADAWDFSSARTSTAQFLSAPRSARTGILSGWVKPAGFDGSNSYGVSQAYHIPSDADSAYLGLWIYRTATSLVDSDRQYVRLIDEDNLTVKADLLWSISNTPAWTYVEYALNTFIGQSFRVQIGTINDAGGGQAAMYYDDVVLVVCKSTPVPLVCTNYVADSGFEVGGAWSAELGQVSPPIYSAATAAFGSWSMRTGIVSGNAQSNSEFYQDVAIPSGVTNARLSFYVFTVSTEVASTPSPAPEVGSIWPPLVPVYDTQYGYLKDPVTDEVLMKLFWWTADNYPSWTYHEYDVSEFSGQTVRILFGTYNNSFGGITSMYLDEVRLETCPDATPIPGPGCYEAFNNRSFESNSEWVIPSTVYPAGYSTLKAYSGNRSMRAGIFYESHNKYSYSDFYQKVKIPASADSATLTFWVWTKSLEPSASARTGIGLRQLPVGLNISQLALAPTDVDLQYLLALDKYGYILTDGWVWSDLRNDKEWKKLTFNVKKFKGQTVRFQFGVYNNGDYADNVTSMFVDSASLIICDP